MGCSNYPVCRYKRKI
ncbi:MAG: hypothetical protein GYA02_17225 [Clostridiaceae bacterium]|nr:hypothetical protein [Clostridiaceae bacterium]